MNLAVEIKNLTFRYNGAAKPVLSNVDFRLEYGKVALLSGMSGEGKSTLFYLINGMIPNVIYGEMSGEVFIDGVIADGKSIGELSKKVGSVLQNADEQIIKPVIKDEIAFGCENIAVPENEIEERIDFSCEKTQLDKEWKTRTLSGGQKQRLITATTLAMKQKIIILDEPLANLDKKGAADLMQTLKGLALEGYAVMIIEHRLDAVMSFVDDAWRIKDGAVEKIEDKQSYLKSMSSIIADASAVGHGNDVLFDIKKIAYYAKKRSILSDVSFDIKRGERIVVLGENGCGKTTFVKILARLLKSSDGEISQNLDRRFGKKRGTRKWFKKVGYVFQNPNYQLFMPSVEQEILFSGYSLGECQRIVDMFGIGDLLSRHPHSLSEGQKRKVSVAAILAAKPDVLILDEPTVGQDYNGLERLCDNLNRLHNENNNTMITITHDMRCAEALCDKAVLIADGKVKAVGGKELVREYFEYDKN